MDGLDIPVPDTVGQTTRFRVASHRQRRPSLLRRYARLLAFLLVVVLPTAAVGAYYFGIASYQYVSEAKFVVRGPSAQAPGLLNGLLQSAGVSRAEEDTYAVQDYIMSRDALTELIRTQDIRAIFNRPEADPLSRFPVFTWRATFEHFFEHYKRQVNVVLDSTTGVSTLTAITFRPQDSERVVEALLVAGRIWSTG